VVEQLWSIVRAATVRARRAGALQPIRTRQTWIDDHGIRFFVRIVDSLSSKPRPDDNQNKKNDPFLPYDPQMFVTDVPPRHVGLLNKFQVVDQHLLIATREFEDQLSVLTENDFEALCHCLCAAATEREALAFYNGGREAGASQSHKHLQLVRLPLAEHCLAFPLQPLWACEKRDQIQQATKIPFEHSLVQFSAPVQENSAQQMRQHYLTMLNKHQLWNEGQPLTRPYNLLLTRGRMLLIPRVRESFHDISLNALGFAGALLVKNYEQLELLKSEGPWAALKSVTRAR